LSFRKPYSKEKLPVCAPKRGTAGRLRREPAESKAKLLRDWKQELRTRLGAVRAEYYGG